MTGEMLDEVVPAAVSRQARLDSPTATQEVLLSVRNLRTTFATEAGLVKAVDGLSFDVRRARCWPSSASPDRASR